MTDDRLRALIHQEYPFPISHAYTYLESRVDPNDPLEGSTGGKLIGPPEPIALVLPLPGIADAAELRFLFSAPGPKPESPPPRA